MEFFPSIFRWIEDILQTSFPFESLKILFLPDLLPSAIAWHECIGLSETLLLPSKRIIDYGRLKKEEKMEHLFRFASSFADFNRMDTCLVWFDDSSKAFYGRMDIGRMGGVVATKDHSSFTRNE